MADVTTIFGAVEDALKVAFPNVPIRRARRPAAKGKRQQGGSPLGGPNTALIVSCADDEKVDQMPTFEHMTVGYVIVVEYVKPAQAMVGTGPATGPTVTLEDPDLRDIRDLIRNTLFKTIGAAVPNAFDTRHRALDPYDAPSDGAAVLVVSGEEFTFTTLVPRPGA